MFVFVGRPTDSEAKRPILRLTTLDPIAVASGGNSKFEKRKGFESRSVVFYRTPKTRSNELIKKTSLKIL